MRNPLTFQREIKKILRLLKSFPIVFLCGLLIVAILIPAHTVFSDDEDDILLYIPAIIAGSAGWRSTTLSHPIPLTYNGYDDALRPCRIVQVEDGSTSKPAILHDYLFDRHGKIIRSMQAMKERDYYSQLFSSLWATRTADGRTVFER